MSDDEQGIELAKIAYRAYGQVTGWKNFAGSPMPAWDDLSERIQSAWVAAALAAVKAYLDSDPYETKELA